MVADGRSRREVVALGLAGLPGVVVAEAPIGKSRLLLLPARDSGIVWQQEGWQ
jgi:hypothetical protein